MKCDVILELKLLNIFSNKLGTRYFCTVSKFFQTCTLKAVPAHSSRYLSPNIDNNLQAFSSNGPEWIIIMKMVGTHCLQLERDIINVSIMHY